MYELKKNVKAFTSKSVGTGPSSCENRIYRAAVSQRLRHTASARPLGPDILHTFFDIILCVYGSYHVRSCNQQALCITNGYRCS